MSSNQSNTSGSPNTQSSAQQGANSDTQSNSTSNHSNPHDTAPATTNPENRSSGQDDAAIFESPTTHVPASSDKPDDDIYNSIMGDEDNKNSGN